MSELFPSYEVGSLPKLNARVKALNGTALSEEEVKTCSALLETYHVPVARAQEILQKQRLEQRKLTPEESKVIVDINALFNVRLQESLGLDYVYDGEARRSEMYRHVVKQISGFEDLPEMIRSRGPDSWRASVCVAPPSLKTPNVLLPVVKEFVFAQKHAQKPLKVPLNDPYMMAFMSDNRYYKELLQKEYLDNPRQLRYEAKRALTLALATNVVRPQVEAVVAQGASWIQLDIPAATPDIEHIPIVVEGINAVVAGIDHVKFSLHFCYPKRKSLTDKQGYELLFPHVLKLDERVNHFSLEIANGNQYSQDLAPFARYRKERAFEIGVGVVDITLERQQKGVIETPQLVSERIRTAADILGDPSLVYVAPDCGLRQLSLERCIQLYSVIEEGRVLARKG